MINLVLYSDQVIAENAKIDARLLSILARKGNRIGYVPSGPEPDLRFFREKQAYYARLGVELGPFFDPTEATGPQRFEALLDCDAIHLPGGNTRGFLKRLVETGLLSPLRDWALNGGLLIGTSAGAILMTPTVALDAVFTSEAPENMREPTALNLVPFEFFPHLSARPDYLAEILRYSTKTDRQIAACRDGDGIVIDNGTLECLGDIQWISAGGFARMP